MHFKSKHISINFTHSQAVITLEYSASISNLYLLHYPIAKLVG